jgi:hypothetical protein
MKTGTKVVLGVVYGAGALATFAMLGMGHTISGSSSTPSNNLKDAALAAAWPVVVPVALVYGAIVRQRNAPSTAQTVAIGQLEAQYGPSLQTRHEDGSVTLDFVDPRSPHPTIGLDGSVT